MKRKNLRIPDSNIEVADHVEVDLDSSSPPEVVLWYQQLLKLGEKKRREIAEKALERIKASKPDAHEFIRKFGCELVGICPQIDYTLIFEKDGELDVTFQHPFSMPTLLYWCESGGFGFFINANLAYNDTVLNKVAGNKVDKGIRGFTG